MRNIILLFFLTVSLLNTNSQTSAHLTREDYLKKSKLQKTAAWVMAGGGTVAILLGSAVSVGSGLDRGFGDPEPDKDQTLADILRYFRGRCGVPQHCLIYCCR